jgi:hypothetical protein
MQHMRGQHKRNMIYYWQLDSSPQAGYDWLMSSYTAVAVDDLLVVHRAWRRLATDSTDPTIVKLEDDDDNDVEEEETDPLAVRRQLGTVLADKVRHHQQLPVALGLKAASLAHKTHAWLWAMALEQESMTTLTTMCHGSVAACTDMGTELGFADVGKFDVEAELRRGGLVYNTVEDDAGVCQSHSGMQESHSPCPWSGLCIKVFNRGELKI